MDSLLLAPYRHHESQTPVSSLLAAAAAVPAWAQKRPPLKIGITASWCHGYGLEAAAEDARRQGLDVRLIEFTDFTTPNVALNSGDLDANFFQHQAFLDNAIKERGYRLKSVGLGTLSTIGVFSEKYKELEDFKVGANGIYNDVTNRSRMLRLLEQVGLIRIRNGAGDALELTDVVENPKKLKFVEVEGPQLMRAFDDLDAAVLYVQSIVTAGRTRLANNALAYSKGDDIYYALRLVTREENTKDPRVLQFLKVYQESPGCSGEAPEEGLRRQCKSSTAWLGCASEKT